MKRALKEPSDVHPTSMHTSVTDRSVLRKSAIARSIRRVISQAYGVSPKACLNDRWKWPTDISASRASSGTSSGWA